ncbi:DUF1223 domain-containing protein [Ruegeria pomeroyi]|nr:DUF1223 domain-containing protein [Ruegeria pomeroyi]MCE8531609.1 DUF1223 domain-containing protein [Ruegeria pomeroyi]
MGSSTKTGGASIFVYHCTHGCARCGMQWYTYVSAGSRNLDWRCDRRGGKAGSSPCPATDPTRMKALTLCLALAASALTIAARAEGPVVVELYTSQGCSSCPPADAIMHRLARRDDVIGLALHVDYWDYIGWADEYADPAHTLRQQAYARVGGRSMIYTPQMIVQGVEDVVGAREDQVLALIEAHKARPAPMGLAASRVGDDITITLTPGAGAQAGFYAVQLVRYTPLRHASIQRGELAGHELDYANVVDSWQVVGQWDGQSEKRLSVTTEGELPAVVLVQQAGPGPILAAARVE